MREQLVLALATVVVIGAIAVIAFAVTGRSNDIGAAPEAAALSGAEAEVIAPLTEPGLVSSEGPGAGGLNDGIEVHGRWTVEVTEADGRFVSLTEFDNSLDSQWGERILSNFLGHVWSPGVWRIRLLGSVRPCETGSASQECEIWELPSSDFTVSNSSWRFGDLSVTAPDSGPNDGALVLSGTATVANATTITDVETGVRGCAPSIAPADADCGGSILTFTSKTLSPGVPVLAGQAVNVTVVISFS